MSYDSIKKKINDLVAYFNPTSNQGNNFWSTPQAQQLVNIQRNNPIDKVNSWLELDKPVITKQTGIKPIDFVTKNFIDPNLRNIRGAVNIANLPSYALGGILKESKAQLKGEKPTTMVHPAITGTYQGIKNKQALFEEAPSALGIDPNSMSGMAIGLTAELATPDLSDTGLAGKVIDKANLSDNTVDLLSRIKNIADKSTSINDFKKQINTVKGNLNLAKNTLQEAGFESIDDYWKYTHEGFNKVKNRFSESLAQTKFRRQKESSWQKTKNFVNEMKQEFKNAEGRFKTLSTSQKVNAWDYIRTPDRVLKKIGLGDEAIKLRRGWDKYQEELPIEIEKVTEWSKRVKRPQSNQLIFKYLDGQITKDLLDEDELKVAVEIKDYLSKWADKLKLPQEARLTNYITHIWADDGTGLAGVDFPEDIAILIRDKVAGSVYDPFVTKRLGTQSYIEDTWQSLDAYIKRATRKVNMDEALNEVKKKSEDLDIKAYNYIKNYTDRINMRPTEIDNLLDETIKQVVGYKYGSRPVSTLTRKARQYVYRGLLGLNPSSALKNLSQGANTYAELGEKYTILGYYKAIRELPKYLKGVDTELEKVGVLKNGFIEDRTLNATRKFWEKTDSVLFYLFNMAEKINRGASYYGAKARALKNGKTYAEAIEEAKDVVRKTQFTFGNIDTPVALQSDLVKTFTQFQSFTMKQGEFLAEKITQKDFAGIVRYIGASLLFAGTVGKAIGYEPKDMIPSLRIGVPPTMQLPKGLLDVATGQPDKYGNEADPNIFKRLIENQDVQKGALSYIPAGNQFKKTVEGLADVSRGYSSSKSGQVRYPVEQTTGNYIKGALIGKYSFPEAQEYYDSKSAILGKNQSELLKNSDDKKAIYEQVQFNRKLADELGIDSLKSATTKEELDQQTAYLMVKKDGQTRVTADKIYYADGEDVKSLSKEYNKPEAPKATQSDLINKELITDYKGKLTKEANNVIKRLELGIISEEEAHRQLTELKELRSGTSTKKAKKITTPSLKKIKAPTLSTKGMLSLKDLPSAMSSNSKKKPNLKLKKARKIYEI